MLPAPRAKLHGTALAWVFQTILDVTGERLVAGDPPAQIATQLRPVVLALLDDVAAVTGRTS